MSRVNIHESRKIFCAYHPSQFLTNFCSDKQCLMPLCPNCIVEHTEQHFLQKNKPHYLNLNDAINETKQKCYQNIVVFEQLSKKGQDVHNYVEGVRQRIHQQITSIKEQVISIFQEEFERYQNSLIEETMLKYKQMDVYSRSESSHVLDYIKEQIQSLYERISMLKTESCLVGLITFHQSDQTFIEEGISEIRQYLKKNQNAGKIKISLNKDKLQSMTEGFGQNNITIQHLQETEKEDKSREIRNQEENIGTNSRFRLKRKDRQNKENQYGQANKYKQLMKKSEQYYKRQALSGHNKIGTNSLY